MAIPTAIQTAIQTRADRAGAAAHALRLACVLAGLCSLLGCGATEAADPRLRERLVSIQGPALTRFLERTVRLRDTPAGAHSKRLLARARGCSELFASLDTPHGDASPSDPDASPASVLDCHDESKDESGLAAFARDQRGGSDGFLSWPLGEDGHVALRIDVDAHGGLVLDGHVEPPSQPGVLALFVPAVEPPAAAVIRPSAALMHLRARPEGGLGLSSLMPSGGQADRLFALKGRFLESALLSGTWELAFLPPAPDGAMPLAVAALHHRRASAFEEALDEALTQLEATWPIRRSPRTFRLADGRTTDGSCFRELPLLPELAPCWAVTPEAFVIGYRAEALEGALSAPPVSSPASGSDPAGTPPAGGRLDLHLDRLRRVDSGLLGSGSAPQPGDLFSKLELRWGARGDGRIAIRAQLRSSS